MITLQKISMLSLLGMALVNFGAESGGGGGGKDDSVSIFHRTPLSLKQQFDEMGNIHACVLIYMIL